MRTFRRNRSLIHDAQGGFPESGGATTLARAEDAIVGVADVGFNAGVIGIAGAADYRDKAKLHFQSTDGRAFDFPEIEMGIEEGHAVGVLAGLRAEVADDADFRFFVFFWPAKDALLLWGKLVTGKNASAVKAEENGGGGLGEDAAIEIAADEQDGDLLRDASAAAHNLWWQERGQRKGAGETI